MTRRLGLPQKAGQILEAMLYHGELPCLEATVVVSTSERQARRVILALLNKGMFTSESSRAPLHLAFPVALASRFLPSLFPEKLH